VFGVRVDGFAGVSYKVDQTVRSNGVCTRSSQIAFGHKQQACHDCDIRISVIAA
jgi:hypothetical protein